MKIFCVTTARCGNQYRDQQGSQHDFGFNDKYLFHIFGLVGMKRGTNFAHGAKAAAHLNCPYEIEFSAEEGMKAVGEVIYALKTFDTTTILASVGIIWSGKGSGEVTQRYLYFLNSLCAVPFWDKTLVKNYFKICSE